MKAQDLMTFENNVLGTIRGFIDDKGEPWFLAAQVCRCLGIKNSRDAVNSLKQRMQVVEDWNKNRGVALTDSPKAKTITLQEGKTRTRHTIIPESWLYELVFASRKQTAIVFRAWVTGTVLPSLRKHGEYRMQGKLIRRSLTDVIKSEIVDKTENPNLKKFAYSNYTKLIYKALGLGEKVERSSLDDATLEKIARKENLVQALILENKGYAEIKEIIMNNISN